MKRIINIIKIMESSKIKESDCIIIKYMKGKDSNGKPEDKKHKSTDKFWG